ncbi:MAG: polysaccharide deacetylase family protein [Oscillospiraceae bacterium]
MMGFKKRRSVGAAVAALTLLLSCSLPLFCPAAPHFVPADSPTEGVTTAPQKLLALTFDDGPRRATTTLLLDGLAERGVPATFFLVGSMCGGNEDVIRRMDNEGHQVGIHTFDHVKLTGLSQPDFAAQVDRTRLLLTGILGHNDFLLRPPFGMVDAGVREHAGAPIILWSVDPEDWGNRNVPREVDCICKKARDGSIILMHDIFYESVEAALQVVDALHRQGYIFVTVGDLLAARHVTPKKGTTYWNGYP